MRKSARRGFTLAEVLVTVTIVAVLAAVMVPAVINQVAKGDAPAVAQDFGGIQTAVTTFATDVHRFPSRLSQLGGSFILSTAKDFSGTAFGTDSARFRGPYASLYGGHVGPTGAIFRDSLFNTSGTTDHNICMRDSVSTGASLISPAQMRELESAIDHSTSAGLTGSVQWTETTNGSGVTTVDAGTARVCVATY